jgi:hypothetical protein
MLKADKKDKSLLYKALSKTLEKELSIEIGL